MRACYAEGRRTRQWMPNLRLLPADEPATAGGLGPGRRSRPARARLPPPVHRPSRGGGAAPLPRHAARRGRRDARRPRRDGPIPSASCDARVARGPRGRRPTHVAGGRAMSTDRDTTRIVRSWLEEGATALPDRVLDAVLDQVPATPQRRAWWPARRFRDMNTPFKLAMAAAAVLVVAFVGINLLPGNAIVGGPGRDTDALTVAIGIVQSIATGISGLVSERPTAGGQLYDPAICGPRGSVRGGVVGCWLHGSGRGGRLDPDHAHRSGWLVRARVLHRSLRRGLLATRRRGFALRARRLVVPPSVLCGARDHHRRADHPDRHDRRCVRDGARRSSRSRRHESRRCHPGRLLRAVPRAPGARERHHRRAGTGPQRVWLLRVGTRDLRPGAERPVAHLGP